MAEGIVKTKLPLPLNKLMAKADRLFQRNRVFEELDEYGYAPCITCGVRYYHTRLDGGHFIGKGLKNKFLAVRYEKNNCWPQCQSCNRYQGGNHSMYRDKLIKIVGVEEVERLEKKKYETVIFARSLYEQVIEKYKRQSGTIKEWLK